MPPRKNRKLVKCASISSSKDVIPGKRRLRRGLKTDVDSKSHAEEVVSDEKVTEENEDDDSKVESVPTPKVKKPCTWLKLDRLNPPVGGKSSLEDSKEAKLTTPVQSPNDNKRKRNEKGEEKGHSNPIKNEDKSPAESSKQGKEAKITTPGKSSNDSKRKRNGKGNSIRNEDMANVRHEETKRDDESEKTLGGLIFMCNAKTKPDCFRYQLMGVPASKKEVVMNIEPGLKIFLYDYDLKLMYGVFEASSPGGMKLEPLAFGGAFPAQVRYIVHKDCLPLPESVFKKAIKDSYNERSRKFKTELTVKQVKNLINLFSPAPLLRPNGKSVPPADDEESLVNRYLKSSDARPPRGPFFLTEEEYRNNGLRPLSTPIDPAKKDNSAASPFLSEKEYRIYGLRGPHEVLPNPYDESTTSLVNRYLVTPPMTTGAYPISGKYNLHEQYQRSYSLNASSHEPSEFNGGGRLHDFASAPVSSRYCFGGPPR